MYTHATPPEDRTGVVDSFPEVAHREVVRLLQVPEVTAQELAREQVPTGRRDSTELLIMTLKITARINQQTNPSNASKSTNTVAS